MKKIINFFGNKLPLLGVGFFWLLIVLTNLKPGTWLLGWDTLLPEFNFALNIKRSLLGTWQEYQGLGIAGGMAHNADLPRQLIMLLWSLFLPDNFHNLLRYAWHLLMLLLGPIGVVYLTEKLLKIPKKSIFKTPKVKFSWPSFVAGLFYLLNLATLQYFFVPYESFSSFYGFLPWLILGLIKILDHFSPLNKLKLLALLLLAAPAFYVQTLFVVYAIIAGFFILDFVIRKNRNGFISRDIKTLVGTAVIFIVATSYWLIPAAYFTITASNNTVESQQNQIATVESQLMNRGFGNLRNILQLKGYWFEYTDLDVRTGEAVYLLQNWRNFANHPVISVLYIFLTLLGIFGLTYFVIKTKNRWRLAVGLTAVFTLIMLTAGNGVLGLVYSALTKSLPLFSQIFRTSFTKWSMVAALLISLGLAQTLVFAKDTIKTKFASITTGVTLSVLIVFSMLPVFGGNLIYDDVRVKIPESYGDFFAFASENTQSHQRIMVLPLESLWGWHFNNWNYRGSGFLWYGIENPIIDRNFDVWSPENEKLYTEFSRAIKNQDYQLVSSLVEKYDISYFLLDESVVTSDQQATVKTLAESRRLMTNLDANLVWNQDLLYLYRFNRIAKPAGTITNVHRIPNSNQNDQSAAMANLYSQGNFIRSKNDLTNYYPFENLVSEIKNDFEEDFPDLGIQNRTLTFELAEPISALDISHLANPTRYSGPVSLEYSGNQLAITFQPRGKIALGSTIYNFQVPNPIIVDLNYEEEFPENLTISLDETIINLQKNIKQVEWFSNLETQTGIELVYFDTDESITENSDIVIDPENLRKNYISLSFSGSGAPSQLTNKELADSISIEIPMKISELNKSLVVANTKSCDTFDRGKIKINPEESKISATNYASACSTLEISGSDSLSDGFLLVSAQTNNTTYPKIFIDNKVSNTIYADEILKPEKNMVESAIPLIQIANQPDNPLALNFVLKSSGSETAEMTINDLMFVQSPLALEEIENISVHKKPAESSQTLTSTSKWGTGIYRIASTENAGGIFLNQSYDPGWMAINTSGFEILEHHKLNDWSNYWQRNADNQSSPSTVFLIYLPQLLVLAGNALILSLVIVLSFDYKRNQKYFNQKGFSALRLKLAIRRKLH